MASSGIVAAAQAAAAAAKAAAEAEAKRKAAAAAAASAKAAQAAPVIAVKAPAVNPLGAGVSRVADYGQNAPWSPSNPDGYPVFASNATGTTIPGGSAVPSAPTGASDAPPNPGDFQGPGTSIPGGSQVPAAYDPNVTDSFLHQFGLTDSEALDAVERVFRAGGSPDQALAALRGTKWYANHYQGIWEGIAKGVIGNEADYRSMLNQTNQLHQRYYGRQIDAPTFAGYLKSGTDIGTISKRLSGESQYGALKPTLDYQLGAFDPTGALTADEQTAYSDELGGLQNPLGDKIALRVQQAQQRIQKVFQGTLASSGLSASGGRLRASSMGSPDISA